MGRNERKSGRERRTRKIRARKKRKRKTNRRGGGKQKEENEEEDDEKEEEEESEKRKEWLSTVSSELTLWASVSAWSLFWAHFSLMPRELLSSFNLASSRPCSLTRASCTVKDDGGG